MLWPFIICMMFAHSTSTTAKPWHPRAKTAEAAVSGFSESLTSPQITNAVNTAAQMSSTAGRTQCLLNLSYYSVDYLVNISEVSPQ